MACGGCEPCQYVVPQWNFCFLHESPFNKQKLWHPLRRSREKGPSKKIWSTRYVFSTHPSQESKIQPRGSLNMPETLFAVSSQVKVFSVHTVPTLQNWRWLHSLLTGNQTRTALSDATVGQPNYKTTTTKDSWLTLVVTSPKVHMSKSPSTWSPTATHPCIQHPSIIKFSPCSLLPITALVWSCSFCGRHPGSHHIYAWDCLGQSIYACGMYIKTLCACIHLFSIGYETNILFNRRKFGS